MTSPHEIPKDSAHNNGLPNDGLPNDGLPNDGLPQESDVTRMGESAQDRELLALVGAGLDQLEPIPSSALESAYSARLMAAVDAQLAELTFDSMMAQEPVMRRGTENESRFLSFTNDHLTLDLSLLADGRTLLGEIDPVMATELVVEGTDGDFLNAPIDEFGRFKIAFDSESFRLRIVDHLVTQWISR